MAHWKARAFRSNRHAVCVCETYNQGNGICNKRSDSPTPIPCHLDRSRRAPDDFVVWVSADSSTVCAVERPAVRCLTPATRWSSRPEQTASPSAQWRDLQFGALLPPQDGHLDRSAQVIPCYLDRSAQVIPCHLDRSRQLHRLRSGETCSLRSPSAHPPG